MENKNIIIILVAVIVVLAAVVGFMLFNPTHAKEPTKIKITSDKEQYEGGKLSFKLTDLNKTPVSGEIVNVTIKNKKGKIVVDDVVKTNSKGKAKLNLDLEKGKYTVNITYGGNENYTGSNTTQKLKIKEEVVEAEPIVSSDSYSQSNSHPSGLSDSEIDAYIQRDLEERAKNGVEGEYDFEEARQFYENVPPEGMI